MKDTLKMKLFVKFRKIFGIYTEKNFNLKKFLNRRTQVNLLLN
jgi:hypothetical protein